MTTQDHSRFVREKTGVVSDYLIEKKKLDNAAAGRGFCNPPGFLYEMQTGLELAAKRKLSDVNYQILDEMLKQELKRAGLDYDLAFKNAQVAWELDKQALLTDWDRELMTLKQAQHHEDELLALLAIEVSKRGNLLIAAKTAIELEAEALKLQIANLDGTMSEYEIQLANAKLLTAQKKLEVIPIIQQIIVIEEAILGKETQLVEKAWILADKAGEMVEKEQIIVAKNIELVARQNAVIAAERQVIAAEENLVDAQEDKVSEESILVNAETATVEAREAMIRPALETLVAKMELYIEELVVQQDIQAQISTQKLEITGVKAAQIAKAEIILGLKQDLAETMAEVITLTEGLYNYKESYLAPAISELTELYNQYAATDVMEQVGFKIAIAGIKEQMAAFVTPQKVAGELSILTAEVTQEAQRSALHVVEGQIDALASSNRVADANDEVVKITAIITEKDIARSEIRSSQENSFNTSEDLKNQSQQKQFDIRMNDSTEIETAQMDAEERRTDDDIRMDEDITDVIIGTDVTARLSHLLSQD